MIRFTTLEDSTLEEILNAFNAAFADYAIPMRLSPEVLERKLKSENIDLSISVGAFDGKLLVGFILHGSGKSVMAHRVYNGGTGVLPAYRGKGLTKKMYEFILPIIKQEKFTRVQLEVLEHNTPAIQSYENVGFRPIRTLKSYGGQFHVKPNSEYKIEQLLQLNWEKFNNCWSVKPTWQNHIGAIENRKSELCILECLHEEKTIGYCIYSPVNHRLMQIGVLPEYRRKKAASTLLHYLAQEFGNELQIINVDHNHLPTLQFFEKIGLKNDVSQIEYELQL